MLIVELGSYLVPIQPENRKEKVKLPTLIIKILTHVTVRLLSDNISDYSLQFTFWHIGLQLHGR